MATLFEPPVSQILKSTPFPHILPSLRGRRPSSSVASVTAAGTVSLSVAQKVMRNNQQHLKVSEIEYTDSGLNYSLPLFLISPHSLHKVLGQPLPEGLPI